MSDTSNLNFATQTSGYSATVNYNLHEQVGVVHRNHAFGDYADKVLKFANETFSTMYQKIFKPYWHDGRFMAKMSQNYASTDWQNSTYEFYVPTRDSVSNNLQFYRVIIKVVDSLDRESVHTESIQLQKPLKYPSGIIDSELIVVVSPKLKQRGFVRGFKHIKKPGYLTAAIVAKFPELAFLRILKIMANFFDRRIKAFLAKLDFDTEFQPWKYDYKKSEQFYYMMLTGIIERYSHTIALSLRCFSHVLAWIKGKIKSLYHEIGLQNMAFQALKALKPVENCSQKDKIAILRKIEAILGVSSKQRKAQPIKREITVDTKPDEGLLMLDSLAQKNYFIIKPERDRVKTGRDYHQIHQHGEVLYV